MRHKEKERKKKDGDKEKELDTCKAWVAQLVIDKSNLVRSQKGLIRLNCMRIPQPYK